MSIGERVLLRASGGKGGLAGSGVRATSQRLHVSTLIEVEVARFGLWTIAVTTPNRELASIGIFIKRTGEAGT